MGKFQSCSAAVTMLILWQAIVSAGIIEGFVLPLPVYMAHIFVSEFPALMSNARITLMETALGLGFGIATGFFVAVSVSWFEQVYKAFYPLIVLTQTVPAMAVAPPLVPWFRYEMTSKVILIVITTLFPITVGPLTDSRSAGSDIMSFLRAVGAGRIQILRYLKPPGTPNQFFSSLRILTSYAVVGVVISEWSGGFGGLGAYTARTRKVSSFDKMSAVIFLISMISLLLMQLAELLQKKYVP